MTKNPVCSIEYALLLALHLGGNAAWAQVPFTPERPGEDRREQLPEIPLEKPSPLPELIPPPPLGTKAPSLSTQLHVLVKKIKLTGNRVISNEGLGKVTARYGNRTLSSEDLQSLRQALTVYYINKGYVNSGRGDPRSGGNYVRPCSAVFVASNYVSLQTFHCHGFFHLPPAA